MERPDMPESTKALQVQDVSQKIGEFLEWLPSVGVHLCIRDGSDQFYPQHRSIQSLLALYFEIDLDKVDREKRALLDWLRAREEATA
jgi:hypothetical protein